MRTLLITFASMLVLAGVFTAYLAMQPRTTIQAPTSPSAITRARPSDGALPLGTGEDVWVKSYDQKTGELSSQFRAAKYDPRDDGSVEVLNPEAEFIQGNQTIRIVGSSGKVVMPPLQGGQMRAGGAQVPSRGILRDVRIELYEESNTDTDEPDLVCEVNNIAFDNDTFRIYTADYTDASGRAVAADQVAVRVRGTKYDFDGFGLLVRWNERDRRLQLLEINRGERLVIKDVEGLGGAFTQTSVASSHGMMVSVDSAIARDAMAEMIAMQTLTQTAEKATTIPTTQPRRTRRPPRRPPPATTRAFRRELAPAVYRATFFDTVRVTQNNAPVAEADRMHVDFSPGKSKPSTNPSTKPNDTPATSPVMRRAHDGDQVQFVNFADEALAANAPATEPATQPTTSTVVGSTTKSAEKGPVEIRWTGKLRVAPPEANSGAPMITPGDSAIEMMGTNSPVELRREGGTIRCAVFTYFTQSRRLLVKNSETFPVINLVDATGAKVETTSIDYSTAEGTAVLAGKSSARFTVVGKTAESSTTQQSLKELLAQWNDRCTLTFSKTIAGRPTGIDRALLEGDVRLDHPDMKLTSQRLDLGLVQSGKADPDLRDLTATGKVKCSLIDEKQIERRFEADHLAVATELGDNGSRYPSVIDASGSVKSSDADQLLECGKLVAELNAPRFGATTSSNDVQVRSLKATQDVKFVNSKGSKASGDKLEIKTVEGRSVVELSGQPFATLTDKTTDLRGAIITFDPTMENAKVIGSGTLHTLLSRDGTKSDPMSPIDVSWKQGVVIDGSANRVDITGDIELKTKSNEGAMNVATGQRMTLTLVRILISESEIKANTAATKPAGDDPFAGANFLSNRIVEKVTLSEGAEVKSELYAADETLIKRAHLMAPTIEYEMPIKAGMSVTRSDGTTTSLPARPARLVIPSAGRMLYQDNSKPAVAAPPGAANALVTAGGATGFSWAKDLVYDEAKNEIVLSGDVNVVHLDDKGVESYHLSAPTMIAVLDPTKPKAPADLHAAPDDTFAAVTATPNLKQVRATGGVTFRSPTVDFRAGEVSYDPMKEEVSAYGTPSAPVVVTRANELSSGSFSEVLWNAKTGRVVRMKDFRADMRR